MGSWPKTASNAPGMITNTTMQVRVSAEIAPVVSLPTSDEITLDGHATFAVIYL